MTKRFCDKSAGSPDLVEVVRYLKPFLGWFAQLPSPITYYSPVLPTPYTKGVQGSTCLGRVRMKDYRSTRPGRHFLQRRLGQAIDLFEGLAQIHGDGIVSVLLQHFCVQACRLPKTVCRAEHASNHQGLARVESPSIRVSPRQYCRL